MKTVLEKNMLTEKELQILSFEFDKKKKSVLVSYFLYTFLGGLLIHRIYIGSTTYTTFLLAYILFCMIGLLGGIILLSTSDFFIGYADYLDMTGGGFLFLLPLTWVFLDIFRIPTIVDGVNDKLEQSILVEILTSRA